MVAPGIPHEAVGIRPGEIDLPCFPMFGLFNCMMGVTAVIPDMDGLILGLERITQRIARAARKLLVISRYGVGIDNIDRAAANRRSARSNDAMRDREIRNQAN